MAFSDMLWAYGLSPRVRGKLVTRYSADCLERSIPACTGETSEWLLHRINRMVYPRVYGGNFSPDTYMSPASGLSPRVRGKRLT